MQNLLIIIGFIGLAAFAYYMLVIQADSSLDTSMVQVSSVESQQFLRQLNQLKAVSFDTDILSNESFRSLVNQSAAVNPQPVGRVNPFIPTN